MKKIKLLALLLVSVLSINLWGDSYTWSLSQDDLGTTDSPATSVSKGSPSKTWAVAWTWKDNSKKYIGWDTQESARGVQIGKGTSNYGGTVVVLSTSGISGTITNVTVGGAIPNSGNANVSVSVGGTQFKYNTTQTTANLTTTKATYSFEGSASGNIVITYTNTVTSKAMYISSIDVTYSTAPAKTLSSIAVTTDPKKEYTTCETLDLSGCVVTATYSDNSTDDVTTQCTFDPANGAALTTAVTSVAVSYGEKNTSITGISVTEGASDTYVDNVHSSVISGDFSCSYSAPPILDKQKGATESCEDTHYHFVGWVEDGTAPTQSPSNVIPAGTAMTGSNKTYKAVWAKEAE